MTLIFGTICKINMSNLNQNKVLDTKHTEDFFNLAGLETEKLTRAYLTAGDEYAPSLKIACDLVNLIKDQTSGSSLELRSYCRTLDTYKYNFLYRDFEEKGKVQLNFDDNKWYYTHEADDADKAELQQRAGILNSITSGLDSLLMLAIAHESNKENNYYKYIHKQSFTEEFYLSDAKKDTLKLCMDYLVSRHNGENNLEENNLNDYKTYFLVKTLCQKALALRVFSVHTGDNHEIHKGLTNIDEAFMIGTCRGPFLAELNRRETCIDEAVINAMRPDTNGKNIDHILNAAASATNAFASFNNSFRNILKDSYNQFELSDAGVELASVRGRR